jgi:hypothetical protein
MKFSKTEYSVLAILSALYVGSVFAYQTSPANILISTIIFAALYVVWGIWHHAKIKNLNGRIMLEYFLVAILGIVIVSTLLI